MPRFSAISAGMISAFVGFSSTFALILQALISVGASPTEAASGLMAVSVAMGLGGIWLSLRYRMPISVAWSTPGAALLVSSAAPAGGFGEAVGAFLVAGICAVLASLWHPLARAIGAIPTPVAQGMLAGILLPLCLVPVQAIAELPLYGFPIALAWVLAGQVNRLYAVPAAVLAAAGLIGATTDLGAMSDAALLTPPVLVMPEFSPAAIIGLGLPLFFVTMASQNVPGIAVLNGFGYRPDPQPLFRTCGLFSLAAAPFGGHAVNLAAITAAICANEEADPDPARRYWSAVVAGVIYALFGVTAGLAVAFATLAPALVIGAVAGLALISAFGGAIAGAASDPAGRDAAIVTFLVAASGVTFFGVSGAFWGLAAGLALHGLRRWQQR